MATLRRYSDATVLAPSPECFAGSTGLQIHRHDARFRFEMTNAGLSMNAELFTRVESSGNTGSVYLIQLNCSQLPPDPLSYSVPLANPQVLLLRGVHDDSAYRSDQLDNQSSVPGVFRKIGHQSLDWRSVKPDHWVSLGRHDILISNDVKEPLFHLCWSSLGVASAGNKSSQAKSGVTTCSLEL